ncbi:MAG: WD40 repeat domain-containing protein [Chitinophagales bacterium]
MKNLEIQNIATLTGHKGGVYALEQAAEDHCFYSADGAGWVAKWNLKNTDTAHLIAKVPSNIFALCLVKDQDLLAVGSLQGILYFIDLQKNEVLTPPLQFPKTIYALQQWKHYLLIGTGDGKLSIFNLQNQKIERTLPIAAKSIRQIKIHPHENIAAIASSDHCIYLLDLEKISVSSELHYHKNSVFCLQFLQNGNQLFAGSRDAHLSVWEKINENYSLQHTIPAHLFTINDIAVSPNQRWIASASRDKSIKIWDVQSLKLLKVIDRMKPNLDAHQHSVNTLLWSPFNDYLLSGSDDKSIKIWQVSEE